MSRYPWKYTVKFIGWNAEEFGLYGSDAHAQLVQSRGDSLLGVLNGDMIATEIRNRDSVNVYTGTRTSSRAIGDTFFAVNQRYNIGLGVRRSTSMSANSDHYSYYSRGYNANLVIEFDFCPYYHTTAYSFDTVYFSKVVKAMVATIATFAQPDTELIGLEERASFKRSSPITILPNPTRGEVKITLAEDLRKLTEKVTIFSADGRLIREFSNKNPIVWDGKKRAGIYFLRIETKEGSLASKLTVLE